MTDRPYITCRELIDFILDYLSGELPADQRAEFERHLAVCPPCQRYLQTYQQTVAMEKQAFREAEDAPADAPEELVRAILASRRAGG